MKIYVITPQSQTDQLIEAMASAGAGVIGNYSHNAFITHGTGNWKSNDGANPTIGQVGQMSREPEDKIEMICPEDSLENVIKVIRSVHPYEEPAIDVFKLYP